MKLKVELIKKTEISRYGNGNDETIYFGTIALFSSFKLTTSSGKHLEDLNHSHIVSLMYTLITSSKDSTDLSIGFERSRNGTKDELTQTKNAKCKYHLRIMLRDVFGFAEHQQ